MLAKVDVRCFTASVVACLLLVPASSGWAYYAEFYEFVTTWGSQGSAKR